MVNGIPYFRHEGSIEGGKGLQGEVGEFETVRGSTFYYAKRSNPSQPIYPNMPEHGQLWEETINEIAHLSDEGISEGFALKVYPSKANFLAYQVESHIVMPNLGTDLRKQFKKQSDLGQTIPDEVRFRVAIEASFELAQLHGGLLSVQPKMHRDLKPGNIVLGPKGVKFIDLGLTENDPDTQVLPDRGTEGYIEFPFLDLLYIAYKLECDNGYERSFEAYCDEPESDCNPETKLEAVKDYYASFAHQHSRTGRFFDLDALRRSLYTPLRANPRRKKDVKDRVC